MDEHIHIHIHHGDGRRHGDRWGKRGMGRGRWQGRDLDDVIAFLERRQRDFEQAAADVADRIKRLRERQAAGESRPEPEPGSAESGA